MKAHEWINTGMALAALGVALFTLGLDRCDRAEDLRISRPVMRVESARIVREQPEQAGTYNYAIRFRLTNLGGRTATDIRVRALVRMENRGGPATKDEIALAEPLPPDAFLDARVGVRGGAAGFVFPHRVRLEVTYTDALDQQAYLQPYYRRFSLGLNKEVSQMTWGTLDDVEFWRKDGGATW